MYRKLIGNLGISLLCVVLGACSTPLHLQKLDGQFPGVDELMQENKLTQILIVHGMGDHTVGYSSHIRKGLETTLELTQTGESRLHILKQEDSRITFAYLKTWDYRKSNAKYLRVYELTWSPITKPVKELSFSEDQDLSVYRENLNNKLKGFVNDYLSDPIIYLGDYGKNIKVIIEQALCIIMTDNMAGDVQTSECDLDKMNKISTAKLGSVSIISHSLGSKIVYDAIDSLARKAQSGTQRKSGTTGANTNVVEDFVSRMRSVYMMANQITFLGLSSIEDEHSLTDRTDSFQKVINIRTPEGVRVQTPLHIVAFTDPNDMLSYPLPDGYCARFSSNLNVRCTNVLISNNKASIFGQFANPITAHTGYDANPEVISLIACGSNKEKSRRCISMLQDNAMNESQQDE